MMLEENRHCKRKSKAASETKFFRMIDIGEDCAVTVKRWKMIVQIACGQFGFVKIA